jgi:hypothetical protein
MLKNENPLMKDGITFYNGIFVISHLMEMAFHFEMGKFENSIHFLAPVCRSKSYSSDAGLLCR